MSGSGDATASEGMTPELAAHLDSVLIGGREQRAIVISDHDPSWATRAAVLIHSIRLGLGPIALSVEHIGSTSVPGLAAKAIIDVLLVVRDLDAEQTYVEPLQALGLQLRVREAGHRMLRTAELDVHLHVLPRGTSEEVAYLDLRDWLRVNTADRELYESTKRALAARTWEDMNLYADAKSEVIGQVLARARQWRATRRIEEESRYHLGTAHSPCPPPAT